MNDQLFQILIIVFSILFSIIGFFMVLGIHTIQKRFKEYDDTLNEHRILIDQNAANIRLNSERDDLIRAEFEKTFTRIETAIKEFSTDVRGEMKQFHEELKGLYKKSTNHRQQK